MRLVVCSAAKMLEWMVDRWVDWLVAKLVADWVVTSDACWAEKMVGMMAAY